MTKQAINVGTTANDKKGDSLRAAFQKVNANFTELYEAVGLAATGQDTALTFLGSTLSTDDSSSIVIDRATTVTSNLSVGGDILPQTANGGDLGSSTLPWRSLYVSNNTIFIGGVPLGIDANGNLTVNSSPVTGGGGGSSLVNGSKTVSLGSDGNLTLPLQGKIMPVGDVNSFLTFNYGDDVELKAGDNLYLSGSVATIRTNGNANQWAFGSTGNLTLPAGGDILDSTGTSVLGGSIGNISNSTIPATDPNTLSSSDSAAFINFAGGMSGNQLGLGTNDGSLVVITTDGGNSTFEFTAYDGAGSIKFPDATVQSTAWTGFSVAADDSTQRLISSGELVKFIGAGGVTTASDAEGNITINYVQGDIRSEGNINIDINLADSTLRRWQFGEDGELTFPDGYLKIVPNGANPYISNIIDNGFGLVSGSAIQIRQSIADAYGISINSSTTDTSLGGGASLAGGSNIDVNGTRIILGQYTANYLDANTGLTGQNKIEINNSAILIGLDVSTITNGTTTSAFGGWTFNGQAGTLTFPDATVQSTAYNPNSIRSEGNINIDINLSDSTLRRWQFGEDGNLTLPQGGNISEGGGISGAIRLTPSGGANEYQALLIYPTAGEGDHIHLTAGGGTTELYLGDDLHYVKLASDGNIRIQADNGVNGAAWTFGTDGSLQIPGDIRSEGNINIEINLSDSTLRRWQFGEDGNLTFPDGTNYAGKDITLPQTTNGIPNKVSWNFSDIAVGSTTTSLEWNLLSSTFSEFLIGTSSAATPFYFNFDGSGQTLGTIDNGGIFGGGKLTFGSTAGNNAGDANAIELKATNGDVYLTSTESVKITVDANDSSARVWTFDPSGNLNVPGGIVAEYEEDFTISTSYLLMSSPPGPVTNTLTFAANGDLTVPRLILGTDDLTLRAAAGYTTSIEAGVGGSIEIGYQGDPPANIYIGTATAGYTTTVRIAGDRIRISADVPTSSKGQSGDIIGLVAFSSTHIYYCTASYDGTTDIWNRVALTGGVW